MPPAELGLANSEDRADGALTAQLANQPGDPSAKSLAPFPRMLAMTNANLEWTRQFGCAFADQQDGAGNGSVRSGFRRNQAPRRLELRLLPLPLWEGKG